MCTQNGPPSKEALKGAAKAHQNRSKELSTESCSPCTFVLHCHPLWQQPLCARFSPCFPTFLLPPQHTDPRDNPPSPLPALTPTSTRTRGLWGGQR